MGKQYGRITKINFTIISLLALLLLLAGCTRFSENPCDTQNRTIRGISECKKSLNECTKICTNTSDPGVCLAYCIFAFDDCWGGVAATIPTQ